MQLHEKTVYQPQDSSRRVQPTRPSVKFALQCDVDRAYGVGLAVLERIGLILEVTVADFLPDGLGKRDIHNSKPIGFASGHLVAVAGSDQPKLSDFDGMLPIVNRVLPATGVYPKQFVEVMIVEGSHILLHDLHCCEMVAISRGYEIGKTEVSASFGHSNRSQHLAPLTQD